jgi:hypothetical protein
MNADTNSSTAATASTKKAKSKRKSKLSDVPTRKAGNQGNFHGSRKAFLEALEDSYLAAVKAKRTPNFWGPTYVSFHQEFDWRIPLMDPYPEGHTFSKEGDDADLDDAGIMLKKEKVEDINKVCPLRS